MTRRFQQMQAEERVALAAMRLQGMSLRAIGSALGRSPGTLSREL
jgi:IS30 family transposase